MPIYVWKGKNSFGEKRKGEVEAIDEAGARAQLKRMRIDNPTIKVKPKDLLENIKFFKPKVTGKDLVIFTRQMSTMIDAGLPLVQCLQILGKQQANPTFKQVITTVQNDVETGTTLADSMRKHPKVFDGLYANMIEAGELGGMSRYHPLPVGGFQRKSHGPAEKNQGRHDLPGYLSRHFHDHPRGHPYLCRAGVRQDVCQDFGSTLPVATQTGRNMSNFVKSNFIFVILLV